MHAVKAKEKVKIDKQKSKSDNHIEKARKKARKEVIDVEESKDKNINELKTQMEEKVRTQRDQDKKLLE